MNDEMNTPLNNDGDYVPDLPLNAEPSSNAPKRRSKKWIILPATILAVVLVAVCSVFLFRYLTVSPFQRTMEAVFPSTEVLFDMQDKGTITVDANIAKDMADNLKSEPLHVKGQYAYNPKYDTVLFSFGHKEDMVDARLLFDGNRLEITSPELIGNDLYYVELDGLKKKLEQSLFAPQSGSDYAMSKEDYDLINQFLDDRTRSEESREVLTKALENLLSKMENEWTVKESTETLELLSGKTKAKVSALEIDTDCLLTLINAILNEWDTNDDLRKLGEDWWKDAGLDETGMTMDQFVQDAAHDYKKAVNQSEPNLVIRYAECNGYFVFAEIVVSAEQKNEKNKFEKSDFRLAWTFHKNPSKNPDFEITADYTLGEKTLMELSVVYDREDPKKSEDFTLTALYHSYIDKTNSTKLTLTTSVGEDGDLKIALKESKAWGFDKLEDARYMDTSHIDIHGSYKRTSRAVHLSIDKVTGEMDYNPVKLDETKISLTLSESGPWVNPFRKPTELLSMTEDDLKSLEKQIQKKLEPLAEKINRGLGVDLLKYEDIVEEPHTAEFSFGKVAYDVESQRVFLCESRKKELLVFNAMTMEKVGSIPLPSDMISPMLSADSGRLLVASTSQKTAYLYDASTLKQIKKLTLPEAPISIALDGEYVLMHGSNTRLLQHIHTDTEETRKLEIFNDPVTITVAHESNVAMICESRYSYYSMKEEHTVVFYETDTWKMLKRDHFYLNTDALPAYNGYAFSVGTRLYSVAGEEITTEPLPPKSNQNVLHYFYADDRVCMTLETSDEYRKSFLYVDGKQISEIPDLTEYGRIYRLTDNKYLIIRDSEVSPSHNYVSVFQFKKAWRIDTSLLDSDATEP